MSKLTQTDSEVESVVEDSPQESFDEISLLDGIEQEGVIRVLDVIKMESLVYLFFVKFVTKVSVFNCVLKHSQCSVTE